MTTLQTTCWVIHPHSDLYTFRKCPWLPESTCSLSPGRQPKYLPKVARLHHTRSLLLNLKGGFLPPPRHLTYNGKEGTGYCSQPPIWRRGKKKTQCGSWENRKSKESLPWSASLAASGSAGLCPVWDSLLVLLHYSCTWMGRALAECLLLGPAWGFRVVCGSNSHWLESAEPSVCQSCSHENWGSWFVCFQSVPWAGKDSQWSYLDEVSGSGNFLVLATGLSPHHSGSSSLQ